MSYSNSAARLGIGSTIGYGATSGGSFTTYGEITTMRHTGDSAAAVKVTNMQSAAGEYIPGIDEPGEYEFSVNCLRADYLQMKTDKRKQQYFQFVIFNGTGTITKVAYGFIMDIANEVPVEDKVTSTVKIKLSGAITVS